MVIFHETDGQSPLRSLPILNMPDLRRRLGDDDELLLAVIKYFQEDAPPLFVEISSAVATKDATRLFVAAHALHGLAINLGAEELAFDTQKIEQIARVGTLNEAEVARQRVQSSFQRLSKRLAELVTSTHTT